MKTFKPQLEALEERTVPTALHVNPAASHGIAMGHIKHQAQQVGVLTTIKIFAAQYQPDGTLTILQEVDGTTVNITEGMAVSFVAMAFDGAGNVMTQTQIQSLSWVGNGNPLIVVHGSENGQGFWNTPTQNVGAVFPLVDGPAGVVTGTTAVTVTMTDFNGNVASASFTVNCIGKG